MVAHQPSKLVVAGSSPVSRSLAPEMGLFSSVTVCQKRDNAKASPLLVWLGVQRDTQGAAQRSEITGSTPSAVLLSAEAIPD